MPRFAVDFLDVLLPLLRSELGPDVTVMSRIPDHVPEYLPLVVIRRNPGGDVPAPWFYDQPWVNVQCWCDADRTTGVDALRAASDLADQVRRILWTAYLNQQIVPGQGWIGRVRESSPPQEISDPDLPLLGRYTATYELRIRPVSA